MKGMKIDASSALIGVLVGGTAAGLCGYFLGRELSRRAAEVQISAEVDAVKDYYRAKADTDRQRRDAGERPGTALVPRVLGRDEIDSMELTLDFGDPDSVTGIISVSGPGDGAPGDSGDDPGLEEQASLPELRYGDSVIYVISLEEFQEEQETYEKTTLTWYQKDGVLIDEDDTPIRDVNRTVGMYFKDHFGYKSEDPHIVYVRNNRLQHDFEIVLKEGAYVDEVLNYGRPQ